MTTVRKTITLTDTENEWIKAQIDSGAYTNDSEVLRDLIRKGTARNRRDEGHQRGAHRRRTKRHQRAQPRSYSRRGEEAEICEQAPQEDPEACYKINRVERLSAP